jgi:hypothetical protein
MGVTRAEIEGESAALYQRAGVDPEREPGALNLAFALPGVRVRFVRGLTSRGRVVREGDGHLIELRSGQRPIGLEFAAGHECGHIARNRHRDCEDTERACDAIAAALIAPRPAMYLLRMCFGLDLPRIATTLCTSQITVARRFGEVFDEPCAIVMPGRVLRSHPGLPADDDLRCMARAGVARGARVIRLTDAKNTVFILGED